jgi:hypothetical protein
MCYSLVECLGPLGFLGSTRLKKPSNLHSAPPDLLEIKR